MVSVHCENNWLFTLFTESMSARCCLPTTVFIFSIQFDISIRVCVFTLDSSNLEGECTS